MKFEVLSGNAHMGYIDAMDLREAYQKANREYNSVPDRKIVGVSERETIPTSNISVNSRTDKHNPMSPEGLRHAMNYTMGTINK